MVQILPAANPSFGSQLISSIGGAIGDITEGKAERRKKVEANRPHAQTFLNSLLKQQGADKGYDPENLLKTSKRADEYISKGYNPTQAVHAAYEDLIAGFPEKGDAKTKVNQVLEGAQGGPKTVEKSLFDMIGSKGEQAFQGRPIQQHPLDIAARAPIEKLKEYAKSRNQELVEMNRSEKEKEKLKSFKLPKPVEQLTYDDILKLPADAVTALPIDQQLVIGKKIAEGAKLGSDVGFASKFVPGGLVQGAERKLAEQGISPIPSENEWTKEPLAISKFAGEVLKDFGLFKVAGGGKTLGQKAALQGSAFGAEKAIQTKVGEGRYATPGEIGEASAFGAAPELLHATWKAGLDFIKKIPKVFESLKASAAATGGAVTEEKIVQEAVNNLEARGVSVVKAAEGDSKALNEIQKEATKVADTFKQAEKFNRKEIEKIRGEKAEKLVQSPLEDYYAPNREVVHRPETLAKDAERIKPLELKIKQSERSLRNLQYDIIKNENYLKEAAHKLNEGERLRVQALIDHNKLSHQKHLNEIRAAQFEIKYGKPPATTEQIKEQIAKSFEEIRAGIKDASAEKVQKLEKALEQNKKAVETAERLLARGELPGPPVFDEFIKIKQEYVKAYGDLIDELGTFIRENKGEKALAGEVANAQKLKQLIQQTREHAKASIVNQTDKRKAMKTLEGASGALWKNLLKDVRTDVDAFKKEWAQVRKTLSPQETKTSEAALKAIKTKKATPKPLEAGSEAKAAAQKKKADQEFKDTIGSFGEKFKSGKSTEKDVVKAEKATDKYLKSISTLPRKLFVGGIIGSLQSVFEEVTGEKIPVGLLGAAAGGRSGLGIGTGVGGATIGYKYTKKWFDYIEAEKLRKLRNTQEFHKYRMHLEERYSKARANRIVKAATQSK